MSCAGKHGSSKSVPRVTLLRCALAETELRAADPGQSAALSTLKTCPVFFWVITSEKSYSWVSVKMLINLEVTSDAEENAHVP